MTTCKTFQLVLHIFKSLVIENKKFIIFKRPQIKKSKNNLNITET